MFFIEMPRTFRVGDRAEVRIDQQPATLWWRDRDTLVINDHDARRICHHRPVDDHLQVFYCADADGTEYQVTDETDAGFLVTPKV
jgi:hypothetical protein